MDNVVVRSVQAPSEQEARSMAMPMLAAFRSAGWILREAPWIPGERRPSLGESLILSPQSQLLLEGDGALRLSFAHPDPFAVAPLAEAAQRVPDTFEAIGGVRYRRLVPRWAFGIAVLLIGLLLVLVMASSMGGGLGGSQPTPADGMCPVGWVPGMKVNDAGELVPDGTCQQLGP